MDNAATCICSVVDKPDAEEKERRQLAGKVGWNANNFCSIFFLQRFTDATVLYLAQYSCFWNTARLILP